MSCEDNLELMRDFIFLLFLPKINIKKLYFIILKHIQHKKHTIYYGKIVAEANTQNIKIQQ